MSQFESVQLTTFEPGGIDRVGFRVTTGVPFAEGALPANQPITLQDEQGRPVPMQSRVMESHGDGSVRWLLLDYHADLEPLRWARHTLVRDGQPQLVPDDIVITTE